MQICKGLAKLIRQSKMPNRMATHNRQITNRSTGVGSPLGFSTSYSSFTILGVSTSTPLVRQPGYLNSLSDLPVMKLKYLLATFTLLLTASQTLHANNTYFLPGDAFFYARLDLESAQKLADSESPILPYGSHSNGGFGCGYIGYKNIELAKMSDATKAAIVDAYRQFRDEVNGDANLGGKMSVFIYSKEYDWKKYGLGLQYNENWVAESVAFGVSRDHVRMENFVEQPSALMQNWRDSNLIAPLPTTNPKLPDGHKQAWTKTPISIDCSKCRILITPNRDFDSYVTPANGQELVEISDGKLTRFIRTNGEWELK